MAWIAGLADKAENILNKLDQNAATALQIPSSDCSNPSANATSVNATKFPPGAIDTMASMKKSLSSGSLSLKGSLRSPTKLATHISGAGGLNAVNTTSTALPTESLGSAAILDWHISSDLTSSRRSSVSTKSDSVAIDIVENTTKADELEKGGLIRTLAKDYNYVNLGNNQELAAFKIALAEVTSERDDLRVRLNALNRDIENTCLKQRIQDLEILAQNVTEERDQAQAELLESQNASGAYVHSISELESNLAKLQQEYLEVAQKLQMQMHETEHQRQDLQDYRAKAQRALQMKDSLIIELKASGSSSTTAAIGEDNNEMRLLQIELDGLRQEQQHLQEENNSLVMQLDESKTELQTLSTQHAEVLSTLRLNEDTLRKERRLEKERSMQLESEQRMLTQELTTLRQQLSNQMAAGATRLQEKEHAIQQLKAERAARNSNSKLVDYDMRVKSLTQALVDKQNAVENITADRNALRIQLEKVQNKLQRNIYQGNSSPANVHDNVLLSNTTDDVKAQFPLLMKETPFDNRVARRVKRAYSSLDSAGIRLGAFLRRYPLMRIFVLMYVGLLHIWVVFVLLSSTPS